MEVTFAHLELGAVRVAVFRAAPLINTRKNRSNLLYRLVRQAQSYDLVVDKGALLYYERGDTRPSYFGPADLVSYLQEYGVPKLTHWMDVAEP